MRLMRTQNLIVLLLLPFLFSCQKPGSSSGQMVFRESQDKGVAILYLSGDIAVCRAGTNYAVVVAHWLNEPGLVTLTGDSMDKSLVNDVRRICFLKENQIILGYGSRPDRPGISSEEVAEYGDNFLFYA